MIQRIQSLYLVIAWGLFCSLFFFNLATLILPDATWYSFNLTGFYSVASNSSECVSFQYSIFIMSCLINIMFFAGIFTYRKRVIQLRICIYLIVFILGILGVSLYKVYVTANAMQADTVYHICVVFPILSSILTYLAFRAIRKDEILVKAYERLR